MNNLYCKWASTWHAEVHRDDELVGFINCVHPEWTFHFPQEVSLRSFKKDTLEELMEYLEDVV